MTDWPEDDLIVMESGNPSGLFLVRLSGDSASVSAYYTPDADVDAMVVSPDGRLAAYHSAESGQDEVYIRAFPDPREEMVVSEGGGRSPKWSPDGATLYYRSLNGDSIYAAGIEREPTAVVVSRRAILEVSRLGVGQLHPDGDRFIGSRAAGAETAADDEIADPIRHIVIHNWFTELARLFDDGRD